MISAVHCTMGENASLNAETQNGHQFQQRHVPDAKYETIASV